MSVREEDAGVVGADRKGIFGWMMFDWAAQPFHTLIITFVFAPYFVSQVAETPVKGQEIWGYATGLGGLAIAFMAPILGAIADTTGPRKPWILFFSILGIIGCWLLWFSPPGSANISLIIFALILALIGMEFAAVFNNAMMPDLVPRSRLGRLSGSAWALGYVGGIISLIIVLGFMAGEPSTGKTLLGIVPLFGLDSATYEGSRASGPLTAIWFLIFVLPMFLFTPDIPRRVSAKGAVVRGLRNLGQTLRSLPGQKSYFSYLISSMLYRDGLNALYAFGGIYAAGVLGWSITQIGVFGILAALTGVIGAYFGGQIDDRLGPKKVVSTSIVVLAACCIVIVSTSPNEVLFMTVGSADAASSLPDIVFYILCGGLFHRGCRRCLAGRFQNIAGRSGSTGKGDRSFWPLCLVRQGDDLYRAVADRSGNRYFCQPASGHNPGYPAARAWSAIVALGQQQTGGRCRILKDDGLRKPIIILEIQRHALTQLSGQEFFGALMGKFRCIGIVESRTCVIGKGMTGVVAINLQAFEVVHRLIKHFSRDMVILDTKVAEDRGLERAVEILWQTRAIE